MYGLGPLQLRNFFIPRHHTTGGRDEHIRVCAIIPTHKPHPVWTVRLVRDLLRWNPTLEVVVVDDCTPYDYEERYGVFARIKEISTRVRLYRTPSNKLKAGAVNYALEKILRPEGPRPSVIITLDDDVTIERHTISRLVAHLCADERMGAVCSQVRVVNKNTNLLTRLQGLEYLNFNLVRLADTGFYHGPLVMHGMLTAFRTEVFYQVGMFAQRHLIEDYEFTARIKSYGWYVALAPDAYAWTEVPETWRALWCQRTRWVYGGIMVVCRTSPRAVIQDVIGHGIFISSLIMIMLLIVTGGVSPSLVPWARDAIVWLSVSQLILFYLFQVWSMRFYAEKDILDWVIRLTLLPEFLYANVLTLVLIGSYLFGLVRAADRSGAFEYRALAAVRAFLMRGFARIGYTSGWGTR